MSNLTKYATHTEIVPANQFCNGQVRLTFGGHPCPLPAGATTRDVLYRNEYYFTLQYDNP